MWTEDVVRHEALLDRAVMKGHRLRLVAASQPTARLAELLPATWAGTALCGGHPARLRLDLMRSENRPRKTCHFRAQAPVGALDTDFAAVVAPPIFGREVGHLRCVGREAEILKRVSILVAGRG